MALSGNFISFESIIESVYRRTGNQKLDLNESIETIGETLRLIGVLPAFKDVTTNGLNGNPIPLEVSDYRVQLPSDYINIKGARKVELMDSIDDSGDSIKRISSFSPMVYATDIFYESTTNQHEDQTVSDGVYDAYGTATQYTVTLVGSSGALEISEIGNLTRTVTFNSNLTTTAADFVTNYAADYALVNITVTSDDADIIFTEESAGAADMVDPVITNTSGDLNATVEENTVMNDPVIVQAPSYKLKNEYAYTYKINNGYIYTNFESGYVELVYTGFVTDDHGYPMIPDDQRFIEAIKWSLIELHDYKKWRAGEITDKVYYDTDQKRSFYIRSAISKASVPSADQMNAIKKQMLRSIIDTEMHDSYFKYSNVGEQRYTHNTGYYNNRYIRR